MRRRRLEAEIDIASTRYAHAGGYLGAQQLLTRTQLAAAIFAGAAVFALGAKERSRRPADRDRRVTAGDLGEPLLRRDRGDEDEAGHGVVDHRVDDPGFFLLAVAARVSST
ncbi:MAG TPA: hypothetical protein VFG35_24895 [Actinoplanes sp.]|nr:hypothetical protein [Actinoplanes sp.]